MRFQSVTALDTRIIWCCYRHLGILNLPICKYSQVPSDARQNL